MGLVAILAVLFDSGFLLECLHSSFCLAAKLTIHFKGDTHLIEQLLKRLHIGTRGAITSEKYSPIFSLTGKI